MNSLYSLSVRLSMETGGFVAGAGMVGALLRKLEQQAIATGASVGALHKSMGLLAGGAALTGVGVLLADGLGRAAKKGAELQTVMAGIGLATGASHAQMRALESSFVSIGLKNQMSKIDVAKLGLASTHAGITDIKQLQASIGTIANFAEVQQLSTHVSRDSAATTGVEYAHIFGAYTPQLLNPLINVLSKALTHTPLTGAAFEALVSQFGGMTASLYGRSTPDQLKAQRDDTMMGVLLGQMGQGSRGGTQFGSGLINLATAKPNTAAWRAEHTLEKAGGGQFFNQDGSFRGVRNLLEIINHAANVLSPGAMTTINKAAFGKVGMKVFGNLEQNARLQQWDVNATTFARIPGIDKQQAVYNATAEGQSQQWHKNIETAVILFGTALLPTLIKVSQVLVGITHNMVDFMNTHQGIVKFAAGFSLVAAGAALIIGPILAVVGAVGLLSIGFGALDIAILPVTLVILGIVAAVSLVVLAITHWSDITRFLGQTVQGVGRQIGGFLGLAGDLLGVLGAIAGAGAHMLGLDTFSMKIASIVGSMAAWVLEVLHLKDAFAWAGSEVQAFLKWADLLQKHPTTLHRVVVQPAMPHPGMVHATAPLGGTTVGLPTYLYLKPIPGAHPVPIHHPVPIKGHGIGGGGAIWDMPLVQGRGTSGGGPIIINLGGVHVAPNAIAVHAQPHHDEHTIAAHTASLVFQKAGDEIVHALTTGAPSLFGLSPVLNTPAPR